MKRTEDRTVARPETMKASVFLGPRRMEMQDIPVPHPGPVLQMTKSVISQVAVTSHPSDHEDSLRTGHPREVDARGPHPLGALPGVRGQFFRKGEGNPFLQERVPLKPL